MGAHRRGLHKLANGISFYFSSSKIALINSIKCGATVWFYWSLTFTEPREVMFSNSEIRRFSEPNDQPLRGACVGAQPAERRDLCLPSPSCRLTENTAVADLGLDLTLRQGRCWQLPWSSLPACNATACILRL